MNMQEFVARVAGDKALADRMSKATDADNTYAIAKEAGLTDSFDTFVDTMKKLNEAAGEVSDAEIDAVVGGRNTSTSEVVTLTVVSGAIFATAASTSV